MRGLLHTVKIGEVEENVNLQDWLQQDRQVISAHMLLFTWEQLGDLVFLLSFRLDMGANVKLTEGKGLERTDLLVKQKIDVSILPFLIFCFAHSLLVFNLSRRSHLLRRLCFQFFMTLSRSITQSQRQKE